MRRGPWLERFRYFLQKIKIILVIMRFLVSTECNAKAFVKKEGVSFMKQQSGARGTHFGAWQIGRFCGWLCGLNPKSFDSIEEPISEGLPRGITIPDATAEQLGEALKSAINTSNHKTDEIIKFVFSQLAGSEVAKAELVIRAVIPMIPAEAVSGFVQTAARARPSLALTVARTAAAMVPEQSERIATALESVVAGAALKLFSTTADSEY
jgi:hypothetical protein